jgi:glycosyltransferase involved in cell wall biosynthesis
MTPKITLGLPTYKGSEHIKESISSIRNQSYTNFRLIISINGVDDHCYGICNDLAKIDSRIEIIYHKKNLSIWENWTEPLKRCEKELFMWVSDDDILPINYIENLIKLFFQFDQKALIYGKFVEFEKLPIPTNHIANGLVYTFGGARLLRKLKFLFYDPSYGKVNALYGLGKSEWFYYAIDSNSGDLNIYDVGFLYDILDVCEIRFSNNIHYRRKYSREIFDKKWRFTDLHVFSDITAFNKTIKNAKISVKLLSYSILPYVFIRSFFKTLSNFIK